MKSFLYRQRATRNTALIALMILLALPSFGRVTRSKLTRANRQFAAAERMREALNGTPAKERTKRDYKKVANAYRLVYYLAPTSMRADPSVVAEAEVLAEMGRIFHDDAALRLSIKRYEFLRKEYPGSTHRFDALFTIAQIYKDDLGENDLARETFEEFLRRYPRNHLAGDARDAIAEIDREAAESRQGTKAAAAVKLEDAKLASLPLVTGIRYWSTPDYTRVAIDLNGEVKYEAGRVPDPDRIFFDLHGTRLASTLVGKSFDVSDGFLKRIRVAQFKTDMTRVVLEVSNVSDYSAFILPNPYRLIIDIHGRMPKTKVAKSNPPVSPGTTERQGTATARKTEAAKTGMGNAPKEKVATSRKPTVGPWEDDGETGESAKTEVGKMNGRELKSTRGPTSEPTVAVVAPREPENGPLTTPRRKGEEARTKYPKIHQAQPTSDGQRSLIRALGLKINKIVVDAGHGGHDTGSIGPNGLLEKNLTLDVALRLGKLLQTKMGADVVYTRDTDTFVPLETRTAIANQAQADLFISIHANSSRDASARGIETYYLNFTTDQDALAVAARENAVSGQSIHELQDLVKKIALKDKIEESREFAHDVQQSMWKSLSAHDKGERNRGVKKAPFIVLIGANMPSILAEISFVSNPKDARDLEKPQYREKIAEALYNGIVRYVNSLSGVRVAKIEPHEDTGQ